MPSFDAGIWVSFFVRLVLITKNRRNTWWVFRLLYRAVMIIALDVIIIRQLHGFVFFFVVGVKAVDEHFKMLQIVSIFQNG